MDAITCYDGDLDDLIRSKAQKSVMAVLGEIQMLNNIQCILALQCTSWEEVQHVFSCIVFPT